MVGYLHTLNDIVWIRWQESHLLIPATWSYPTAEATSQRLEEKKRVQDILVQDLDFDIPRLDWHLGLGFWGEGWHMTWKWFSDPKGALGVVDVKIGSTYEVLVFPEEMLVVWEPWFGKALSHDYQGNFNGRHLKSVKDALWQWNLQPKSSGGKGLIAENEWKTLR